MPQVPSARELANDGVKLAEMEMVLLKKIEELTLHMIQMSEKMQMLEQEVKACAEGSKN